MLSPVNVLILIGVVGVLLVILAVRVLMKLVARRRTSAAIAAPLVTARAAKPVAPPRPVAAVPAPLKSVPTTRPAPVAVASHSMSLDPADLPSADDSDYAFGWLTSALAGLLPESAERKAANRKSLHAAGFYGPHAWHNLAAFRYLGIFLPIVGCLALLLVAPRELEPLLIVGLVALPMLGWALPTLYVRKKATERLAEIEQSMPDLLDMMNMCVSQGMTVPASLERVSRDIAGFSPALAKELRIVNQQARTGSLEQALVNFGRRIDLPEVYSFTSLLIQTERMGTSMSDALSDYSDSMRESLRQKADQRANTASFKLLFPTVLCLMPAIFLILLGPAVVELSDFFTNNTVLEQTMPTSLNSMRSGL